MKVAYIFGRFQPFHIGHKAMIDKALEIADRVAVIIGDTGCMPDYKNPWGVEERVRMVRASYPKEEGERLHFTSVEDIPYDDDAWVTSVKKRLAHLSSLTWAGVTERFLVGFKKDDSSFYLDMFPEWRFVEAPEVRHPVTGNILSATDIRRELFWMCRPAEDISVLPDGTQNMIDLMGADRVSRMTSEAVAVMEYLDKWDCRATREWGMPTIAAADALLYDQKSVLLIRRGGKVGKGALALPGGFVDPGERLLDTALRELHEEAGILVPRSSVKPYRHPLVLFDHPGRSMRGRIVTNVLKIHAPDFFDSRPVPVAGDDADEAMWVERSDLPKLKRQFFSDHYHIIDNLLN